MSRIKAVCILVLFFACLLTKSQAEEGRVVMQNKDKGKSENICGLPLKDEELKKILTPEQYRIMRQNGTELPFKNAYWDNHRQGLYVDAITGAVLFSSEDKFDSDTGWPSFTKPISGDSVTAKPDASYGIARTEVRSKSSDSHLGHVFGDGPQPTGQRYCINSASLRFIPVEELEKEGYGQYLPIFKKQEVATAAFAAGCFWGVEYAFRQVNGVLDVASGYMGGKTENPTYEQVCTDKTGHAETVLVKYDSAKVSYEDLLDVFWSIHDPTTPDRQGPDMGSQYRSVIFYYTPEQGKEARASLDKLQKSGKLKRPIDTELVPAKDFYKAEEYHQQYYEKKGEKPSCILPTRLLKR